MTKLRDVMETSSVSIKQIQDYHKKCVLNDFEEVRSRNRGKSLQSISRQLGISESTIQRYRKDMNYPIKHRQLSSTQKYESQLKMQLGKAKARWTRDAITEDEYKKKVSEIENKFGNLMKEASEVSSSMTTRSKSEIDKSVRRGGGIDSVLDPIGETKAHGISKLAGQEITDDYVKNLMRKS